MIKRLMDKYTGQLRSWKWVYWVNNLLNRDKLQHNQQVLSRMGLDRNLYKSIGTKDLPHSDELPWLDQPDALEKMKTDPVFQKFGQEEQDGLVNFVQNGFLVLKGHFLQSSIDQHNEVIRQLRKDDEIYTNYGGIKMMDVHQHDTFIDSEFFRNPRLLELIQFIFRKKVIPFQTIHFQLGSEQKAHSDSIHMSTYPPGYLVGVWTALEDIGKDQGPVFYYPGSHRWPYVSCEDYQSGNSRYRLGMKSYRNYEDYMAEKIQQSGLEKKLFTAEAGDVLIWHANLIHGGSPMIDKEKTRRSMVGHYYADDVFCYHEISQRAALIDQKSV